MSFAEKLSALKAQKLYRKLINTDFISPVLAKRGRKKLTCFSSNDYFGLATHKKVKKAAIKAIKKFGVGAKASRYLGGNNALYEKLEKQLASYKKQEDAMVFSSGYQAAIGIIPALVTENDLIIADKLIHACLIDGARLSGAKLIRFKHNDINHAKKLLQENRAKYQKTLIITENVFSMDGDCGKTKELQDLAQEFNCIMLIDGAHDINNISTSPKTLHMGTLSKAIGSFGGFVASDKLTIDYLRNFAKSAIYTTALPPCILAASLASLKIINDKNLNQRTMKNAQYFSQLMNLKTPESPIIVIKMQDSQKTLEITKKIEESGFLISAIRPPTTATPRLRITFSALHSKKQIECLAKELKKNLLI